MECMEFDFLERSAAISWSNAINSRILIALRKIDRSIRDPKILDGWRGATVTATLLLLVSMAVIAVLHLGKPILKGR